MLLWLLLIVTTLGVLGFVFTQTSMFRRLIVNEIVKTVEQSTNGTIEIGRLEGNLYEGFMLYDVRLKLKTNSPYDTVDLIRAKHVAVEYNILKLLDGAELGARSMIFREPTINFVKFKGDTNWNFGLLTKPVAKNQPPPQPFTQIIRLENIRIINGNFRVRDFNSPEQVIKTINGVADVKDRYFDWSDLRIENLDIDGHMFAKGESILSAKIDHLRMNDKVSGFFIHHVTFSAYLDSLQSRIDNAKIMTGHSNVNFSLEVAPPSVLQTGLFSSLEESGTQLVLNGPTISTYELKQFIPDLGFLGGEPGIDLVIDGELGELNLKKLRLNFKGLGDIEIKGRLDNLHDPEKLYMDLHLVANSLSNSTVRTYVPGLGIPYLAGLGTVNIPKLTYTGTPYKFASALDVKTTGAGNARGTVALDMRTDILGYTADLTTAQLNFGRIINDPDLATNLNGAIKLDGRGTDYRRLTSTFSIKTTAPSSVGKYAVTYLNAAGLIDRGRADIDHLAGQMVNGPTADIDEAVIDFARANPSYYVNGSVTDLRIAQFMPSFPNKQLMIDFDANISGVGDEISSIAGTIDARAHNIYLAGEKLKDIYASVRVSPDGGDNLLELTSDIADININGRYKLSDLTTAIPRRISAITTAIAKRHFPEPGDSGSPLLSAGSQCGDSVNLTFDITAKDLRPLSAIMPKMTLLARGNIAGEVVGCSSRDLNLYAHSDSLTLLFRERTGRVDTLIDLASDTLVALDSVLSDSLLASRFASDSVSFADSTLFDPDSLKRIKQQALSSFPRIQMTPTKFSLKLENMVPDPETVLDSLIVGIHFSDSLARFNSMLFRQPVINVEYRDQHLRYDASTWMNNKFRIGIDGRADFPQGDLVLVMDTLDFQLKDQRPLGAARGNRQADIEYRWLNRNPVRIRMAQDGGSQLDTVRMAKLTRGREIFSDEVILAASIRKDTINYAFVELPELTLKDLVEILPPSTKTTQLSELQGRLTGFRATLSNTLAKPEIDVEGSLSQVIYKELKFDSSRIDLQYHDMALRGEVYMKIDTARIPLHDFSTITIPWNNVLIAHIDSVPMLISFAKYPGYSADSAAVVKRPLSAGLTARNFPIDILSPFLPMFTTLTGIGNIVLNVTGTQENIDYRGSADIDNGGLLLAATNVYYTFDGGLEFNRERLDLRDLVVRNAPADDPNGMATISGGLDLKGFSVEAFDLSLDAERITVLTNASVASMKQLYGPLAIGTVSRPLTFSGTSQSPILEGNVQVKQAFLTYQNTNRGKQRVSTDGIVYRYIVNDSLISDSAITAPAQYLASHLRDSATWTSSDDSLWPMIDEDILLDVDYTVADSMVDEIQRQRYLANPGVARKGGSFADRLQYNLYIDIPGDAWIITHFASTLGVLGERLKAELKTDGPLHVYRGPDKKMELIGTIRTTDRSEYHLYKTFVITNGEITFTGELTEPTIDITAEHKTERATIQIRIYNTIQEPKLDITILQESAVGGGMAERQGTQEELQEDAIYFLLTGHFKNELAPAEKAGAIKQAANQLGSQVANQLLGSLLGSSVFRDVLRSANLEFGANPRLKVTAAFKNINFKYAGGLKGSDYSIEVPLSMVGLPRSTLLEVSHQSSETRSLSPIEQAEYLAKVLWRIPIY